MITLQATSTYIFFIFDEILAGDNHVISKSKPFATAATTGRFVIMQTEKISETLTSAAN
jgi:hypothetical protein